MTENNTHELRPLIAALENGEERVQGSREDRLDDGITMLRNAAIEASEALRELERRDEMIMPIMRDEQKHPNHTKAASGNNGAILGGITNQPRLSDNPDTPIEVNEIFHSEDRSSDSVYRIAFPVLGGAMKKEEAPPLQGEVSSLDGAGGGGGSPAPAGDCEPVQAFQNPRDTEQNYAVNILPARRDRVSWFGRQVSLYKKHELICKQIHYHKMEQMESLLNQETPEIQARLFTMRNKEGLTFLMKAIVRQSVLCLARLLQRFEALEAVFDYTNIDKLDATRSKCGRNIFHLIAEVQNGKDVMDTVDMCYLKEIICDLPDTNGVTPLITACKNGNRDMALRLLMYKAKIDHIDNDGYSPIYLIASGGCPKTLEFFLVHGISGEEESSYLANGDYPDMLLKNHKLYKDRGTILQAILEGRTSGTVQTCFNKTQQNKALLSQCLDIELQNNPLFLHSVCETSLSDILEVILEKYEAKVSQVDEGGMTPLMRAVTGGQLANVQLLLQREEARKTIHIRRNSDKKTALMIGCAKGYREIVDHILQKCPEIKINSVDSEGKNVFHYGARHYEVLKVLINFCDANYDVRDSPKTRKRFEQYEDYERYLKTEDIQGDISLHIAAVIGSPKSVDLLLKNSVPWDMVNCRMKRNTLHYAVCSNLATVKALVEYVKANSGDQSILTAFINTADCRGQTSLHLAASLGHWQTVTYLLESGAEVICNTEKETPLHLAAALGCVKTVQCLINADMSIIHQENRVGETAAMFAAVNGKTEVLKLLLDNKAKLWASSSAPEKRRTCLDWAVSNKHDVTASLILDRGNWKDTMNHSYHGADGLLGKMVKNMPNIALKVLDKCVKNRTETNEKVYDFFAMQTLQESQEHHQNVLVKETKALASMAFLSSDECLRHELVQKFLSVKWQRAKYIYLVPLVLYTMFLISLTSYIGLVRNIVTSVDVAQLRQSDENSTYDSVIGPVSPDAPGAIVMTVICLMFASFGVIKELVELRFTRLHYFRKISNYMEAVMYCCVFIFLLPVSHHKSLHQWRAGAIAIFLSWLNFTGYVRNFWPSLGIYIIMAKKIFYTFLKVFVPLSFFVMAFAMSFFVLFRVAEVDNNKAEFRNIARALVTSFAMMVGEINYRETFLDNADDPHFVMILIFLVIFMVVMTILLMNLLTGLAVGDTGEILQRAMMEKRVQEAILIFQLDNNSNKYPCLAANYIPPLHESVRRPSKGSFPKRFMALLFPEFKTQENEDSSSMETNYLNLKNKLDEIAIQLGKLQKALENGKESSVSAQPRNIWSKRRRMDRIGTL